MLEDSYQSILEIHIYDVWDVPVRQGIIISITAKYQLAACKACSQLVQRLLYVFCVCLLVCASALIICVIITPHTLLPCDFTSVDFMAALSTGVATELHVPSLIPRSCVG